MTLLSMDAKELMGTNVSGVALVKHGAVRIPFRMVKSEDGKETPMSIDLGKIGQALFKSNAATGPATVTAVVFSKAHTEETAKQVVAEFGFEASSIEKTESGFLAKIGDGPQDGDALIKLNDSTAMVVANVAKAFQEYDFESTDFEEVMKTEAFFPAMQLGMEMFSNVVANIMHKSETAPEAADRISKAAADFGSYMSMLASRLPEQSFKTEKFLAKMDMSDEDMDDKDKKKKKVKKDDESTDEPVTDAADDTDDPTSIDEPATNEPATEEGSEKTETPAQPVFDQEAFTKSLMDSVSATLSTSINDLKTEVFNKMDEDMTALRAEVDSTKESVAKADKVLTGTLFGADPASDKETTSKKSEVPPLMDTAYMSSEQVANL